MKYTVYQNIPEDQLLQILSNRAGHILRAHE